MKKILMAFTAMFFTLSVFALGVNGSGSAFGENLLTEKDSVNTQLANASKDYLVTAGDIYQLSFAAGNTAVSYTIPVDSTYAIKIANLGTINGEGKTFLQLKKNVEDIVNRNYPMSGVQFYIITPAVFKVVVKGEVNETKEKQVWAMNRVSSLFDNSLTEKASRRFVKIISKEGTTRTIDLFDAKRNGNLSSDPYLRPDDTVVILESERVVSISGAVERPGKYELVAGENVVELVYKYAGGLKDRADTSKIELSRTYGVAGINGKKEYYNSLILKNNIELFDDDKLYIYSYDELKQVLFFEGAVNTEKASGVNPEASNKMSVTFDDGENYGFLIRKYRNTFAKTADLKNAYVIRDKEIIPINIESILYDNSYDCDVEIEAYDVLRVPFIQTFVTVAGAVTKPGRYPYIPDRTWDYYIGLAGGFDKSRNTLKQVSIVDKDNKKLSKSDPIGPETTITADTNSFTYYFNTYAPMITTALTAVSTIFTIIAIVQK